MLAPFKLLNISKISRNVMSDGKTIRSFLLTWSQLFVALRKALGTGRPWMALGFLFRFGLSKDRGVHNLAMVFLDGVEILLKSCDRGHPADLLDPKLKLNFAFDAAAVTGDTSSCTGEYSPTTSERVDVGTSWQGYEINGWQSELISFMRSSKR